MVTAVLIGDGICAVLKHDTHARDALGQARVNNAPTIGDAANQTEPLGDPVFNDADRGINGCALGAATVYRSGKVDCIAGTRVLPDFCQIGQQP